MKRIRRRARRVKSKWKEFKQNLRESFYQMLLLALAIMGTMHFMGWKQDTAIAVETDRTNPLTENQVRRLVVDLLRDRLIIQEKDKETKVYSGVRKAEFTELSDGKIDMNIPTKGFTFEPGMAVAAGDGLRIGADLQFAYWKRWGLLSGITTPVVGRDLSRVRGHLGLSYSPYWRWVPNTSVWGGIDTSKEPIFGIRTRF